MYSHQPQPLSNLSRSLPPTPSQLHSPDLPDDNEASDDYFVDSEDVPLPFPIQTIVADPQTGLSLTLISALGAGSYAVVYLAREVASGTLYALKCLGKDKLTDEEVAIQRNEVVIHTSLPKHRNIIHLFNMFETKDHLFLLLEYSSGMDMYQWISMRSDKADPITGELYSPKARYGVIKTVFDQVMEGVGLVHACGVAHRDLKPENFLIEFSDGHYTVKLTDFGLATTDSQCDEFECGSKPYMSFECRNGLDATYDVQMADIWSLGIILINLLYHRCPWSDPCPQESYAFSEFLKSRVDFLQRRFEDMPGSVARWLGLRAFAFVGNAKCKKGRTRPSINEWKAWMVDFVPRMLGQISLDQEEDYDYDDKQEYREYLELFEDDILGQEVEGDEILDNDNEDYGSDNQVVPIAIQSSSVKEKQYLHPEAERAYASYHAKTHNTFTSSSVPKFDPSAFYQPARLRQESWSDAIDMEGTEDAEMDFSAPILFEESEEDDNQQSDDEDDASGLAVALPDDFIDPLPGPSVASSGRQTPSTPTMTHLNFNSEKRQLPVHLRSDVDLPGRRSPQESTKRIAGRGSPGPDLSEQINTLVFIEPDVSRVTPDPHQITSGAGGHAIASSLPLASHIEANLGSSSSLNKEQAYLKQQVRTPARNLQDVKAVPFVFPPLKPTTTLGNPHTDSVSGLAPSSQLKDKSLLSQTKTPTSKKDVNGLESMSLKKIVSSKTNPQVTPKQSQLGLWANSSAVSGPSRLSEPNSASHGHNFKWRGHRRGGSWTSIDDGWDSRRDINSYRGGDGSKAGSGTWRARQGDREDGHGLPPRAENKFRPRYRQGRRFPPQSSSSTLPPAPPMSHSGYGAPRSRHQSRHGAVFDSGASTKENDVNKSTFKELSCKDSFHQQRQHQEQQPPKYEHSQLRMHKVSHSTGSKLAGQRNKSLIDLRAIDVTSQPWRQPEQGSTPPITPTMTKARSQAGAIDSDQRKGSTGAVHLDSQGNFGGPSMRNRLANRQSLTDFKTSKDSVYHPPHWHERNNSSPSAGSLQRPSSGYESDFSGWQKQDGSTTLTFTSKNKPASKGRHGHHSSSSMSSSGVDRKHIAPRQADTVNSWRGGSFGSGGEPIRGTQDRLHGLGKKPSMDFNSLSLGANASQLLAPMSPQMTLTPPTPKVVRSEFLTETPTSTPATTTKEAPPEHGQVPEGSETKKIVKAGAMAGLGNMLRGLVAYNKNIKVGGEGVATSQPQRTDQPSPFSADEQGAPNT